MNAVKEYHVIPGTPCATTFTALRMMRELVVVAEEHGFMLGLYGSTVRYPPDSRPCSDVNMFAVPDRPAHRHEAVKLVESICRLGYVQLGQFSSPMTRGTTAPMTVNLQETASGVVLALNFRELERY
jgi:hypothetical protein